MLKPNRFIDVLKGIDKISEFIETNNGGDVKFEKDVEEKRRRKTWFLDTATHSHWNQ
jgi:hypothetical protein